MPVINIPAQVISITDTDGSVTPLRDIETINLELIAADRETVAKRAERAVKMLKSGEKRFADEAALGEKLLALAREEEAGNAPFQGR